MWASDFLDFGEARLARGYAEKAVALDGQMAGHYHVLADALLLERRVDDSVRAYERAVELDDENALLRADLAGAYLQAGRNEDARKTAEKARKLGAKDHWAFREMR